MKKNNLLKILILLFTTAFVITSCGSGNNVEKKKEKLNSLKKQQAELNSKIKALENEIASISDGADNTKYKPVIATTVKDTNFVHYIDVQGKIDVEENVTISAKMPATVTRIYTKAGKSVKAGELLAELDNSTIVAGINEVKTGLQLANSIYEKQKNLWDQKIGTEVQYLQAKTQKESLEKKLISLQEQLDMTKIKSPIDGVVDEVMLRIGQGAAPGVPAIRIVNLAGLKAKAEISETYAGRVKEGNTVSIKIPDIQKEIQTRISYCSKVINPLTRTFTVEASIDPNQGLHANMMAVLMIADYYKDTAIVVPINVVQNGEDSNYILVAVEKNKKVFAEKRVVKPGLSYNGKIEIISGIVPGDKIITTGFQDLNPGDALLLK